MRQRFQASGVRILLYSLNGVMVFWGLLSAVGLFYYGVDASFLLVIGLPGFGFTALWGYFDTRAIEQEVWWRGRAESLQAQLALLQDLSEIHHLRQRVRELEAQLREQSRGDTGS